MHYLYSAKALAENILLVTEQQRPRIVYLNAVKRVFIMADGTCSQQRWLRGQWIIDQHEWDEVKQAKQMVIEPV